ncbi:site-specific DNA-methyltransferase [Silvibacterium dinghuense]|uniref:site-specific DNA-methyltransferase (adenine-specific) n=1 Tax=Silvibacterium dinghuense TaxID=1560006 RepID=A0A4Q1SKK0_9BACT|nr:site-specific DNA-methyltransferase [Silvibacterium dinghuense]RXS97993.1 site-specific DNA-methyltransferase [Silvibacterium dinghuense]GGH03640.1 site-specific DNA-methyltransferase [Silvibacterium dinghuense]
MEPIAVHDPLSQSADLTAENIEHLRELFPQAVTEDAGPNGVVSRRIDFDVLRELLGGELATDDEKYGLNWHGKRAARRLALTPSTGTLRPAPEESVDWDTTQNLMIEGDNLEVLKLLQKSYAGKIKMIYIDPPYNTGKDFVYKDDFRDSIGNYQRITGQRDSSGIAISSERESSGRLHTDWLNMMYCRLMLARNLLVDHGVIFISIDEGEVANLLELCNEVFGEENDLGTLVWKGSTDNNPTQIAIEHEYILCFARSAEAQAPWKDETDESKRILLDAFEKMRSNAPLLTHEELQQQIREYIKANRATLASITHYDRVDAEGLYTGSRKVHNPKPGGYKYDVWHPVTGKVCTPPVNGYRFPETRMKELLKAGRVIFGEDEDQIIQLKQYLSEYEGKLSSVINLDSRTGANELNKLFGVQKIFSNPKPEALLFRLFGFVTTDDDIALDFFAGSGSSAQAIRRLNHLDGGSRRFILVQIPEVLDPKKSEHKPGAKFLESLGKPLHITELTKERLRRSSELVVSEGPKRVHDLGFRVFKLDTTSIRPWDPTLPVNEQRLLGEVDNILPERTEHDLLYELLLKRGIYYALTAPIVERTFAGRQVFAVSTGDLIACLAPRIETADVEPLAHGIVAWHKELAPPPASDLTAPLEKPAKVQPPLVVFRDTAFVDDVAKSNLTEILKQHGLTDVRSL